MAYFISEKKDYLEALEDFEVWNGFDTTSIFRHNGLYTRYEAKAYAKEALKKRRSRQALALVGSAGFILKETKKVKVKAESRREAIRQAYLLIEKENERFEGHVKLRSVERKDDILKIQVVKRSDYYLKNASGLIVGSFATEAEAFKYLSELKNVESLSHYSIYKEQSVEVKPSTSYLVEYEFREEMPSTLVEGYFFFWGDSI
jgi:hypothetical protein